MIKGVVLSGALVVLAALPGTDNYQLRDYGFGNGSGISSSDNYSVQGLAGELSYDQGGSTNYGLRPGLLGSQLSNLPGAPTFTNPGNWYNRLQLVIDTAGNPADTTYAVAISDDGFVTTRYVQSDDTVGASLGPEDFRDFADWGDASGINVIGLRPDTTYSVKVKARQGEFSETGFGPTAAAATSNVELVFDIDVSASDSETGPPYNLDFGSVSPGTVTDSPQLIWLDLESNADNGAFVYIVSDNEGLLSASAGHTISAITGDLSALGEGIGGQSASTTQSSGGPLMAASPFDGSSANVGAVDLQFKQLLTSAGPLVSGRASFLLKIKTSDTTPSANDYGDILTMIATAAF